MKKGLVLALGLPSGIFSLCVSSRTGGLSPKSSNMEEITERCAGLQLSSREDAEVIIHEPVPEEGLVLLGKFHTKRRVNLESVARVLKSMWKNRD